MKERGRRERGAKQSHPFLIKAVAYTSVVLHDNPAKSQHTGTLIYHSKFTPQLGILAVSHRTHHPRFHHHLIRQRADSLISTLL